MSVPYACGLWVLAAALALGQAPAPAPEHSSDERTGPEDPRLEEKIRDRFAKSKIAVNDFEVRVVDGEAILQGRTDVVQHKGTAARLAKLAGAKRVDNRIEVTDRAREKASRAGRSQPRRVRVQWPERDERQRDR